MCLAYCRGLLTPDYKNGLQSRLRENMILRLLDDELISEYTEKTAFITATSIAPALDPKRVGDFLEEQHRKLVYAAAKREYEDTVYHSQAEIDKKFNEQAALWFAAIRGEDGQV